MSMKFTSILILQFIFSFSLFSQNNCDGIRYKQDVFSSIDSTKGVYYGENKNLLGIKKTLLMDIYYPSGDSALKRPLIIFAHPGSFIAGNRGQMSPLCREFSKKGFVTATISYRLLNPVYNIDMKKEVVMATHDMKAAIRHFKSDADNLNLYKIDTSLIFVSGASAGGVVAAHVGYLDLNDFIPSDIMNDINQEGGIEGTSNNLPYSSKIAGVLNYSGSIGKTQWLENNLDVPMLIVHENGDQIVPCGVGLAPGNIPLSIIQVESSGGCALQAKADSIGLFNKTIIINTPDHVGYFLNGDTAVSNTVIRESASFMHDIICQYASMEENMNEIDIKIYPNPASNIIQVKNLPNERFNFEIIDFTGRKVKEGVITNNNITVTNLKKSSYVLRIYNENMIRSILFKKE